MLCGILPFGDKRICLWRALRCLLFLVVVVVPWLYKLIGVSFAQLVDLWEAFFIIIARLGSELVILILLSSSSIVVSVVVLLLSSVSSLLLSIVSAFLLVRVVAILVVLVIGPTVLVVLLFSIVPISLVFWLAVAVSAAGIILIPIVVSLSSVPLFLVASVLKGLVSLVSLLWLISLELSLTLVLL